MELLLSIVGLVVIIALGIAVAPVILPIIGWAILLVAGAVIVAIPFYLVFGMLRMGGTLIVKGLRRI